MTCSKSISVKQSDRAAKPLTMRLSGCSSQNESVNDQPLMVPVIASAMQKPHLPHFSDRHESTPARVQVLQPEEVVITPFLTVIGKRVVCHLNGGVSHYRVSQRQRERRA